MGLRKPEVCVCDPLRSLQMSIGRGRGAGRLPVFDMLRREEGGTNLNPFPAVVSTLGGAPMSLS